MNIGGLKTIPNVTEINSVANKKDKMGKLLVALCIIDVILFPYIRFLSCSLSMIIVSIWHITHLNKLKLEVIIFFIIAIVSLLFGFLLNTATFNNVATAIIILFSFLFYYFFYYNAHFLSVKKIFVVFLFISLIFSIIYIFSPQKYFDLRSFWAMSGQQLIFNDYMHSRYAFLFSDPNNAGGIFVSVFLYLIVYENVSKKEQLLYLFITGFLVISTLSVSAVFLFIIACAIILFFSKNNLGLKTVICISAVFAALGIIAGLFVFSDNVIISSFSNRLDLNINDNLGGGRFAIWEATLRNCLRIYNLIIGQGNVTDIYGFEYRPHNGFIYLLISFGLFAVVIFAKTFFKFSMKNHLIYYAPIIPLFITIFMNTGFSDYRFIAMFAIITAYTHYNIKILQRRVKKYGIYKDIYNSSRI